MIRPIQVEDWPSLAPFLVWSMDWRGTGAWTWNRVLNDPHVSRYADAWGLRDGDGGVLATAPADHTGAEAPATMLGAAWWRLFDAERPGYGFVAADVPELGLAVAPEFRGRGWGARLLGAAVERARDLGHQALSLSVEDGNQAARGLYEAAGFTTVGREGDSDTMLLEL